MKYMYEVKHRKPNFDYIIANYYGGDTEVQAIENAIESTVDHHNRYESEKITNQDIHIVSVRLIGDYDRIMKELSNDRS